jgi:carbonic anhydrase
MKKLIQGIVEFRKNVRPEYREKFAQLALGQAPDALLIACSDSRVVPNLFASADPGDLFVIRNVGNLVAPGDQAGGSEAAAIEFALSNLPVTDVIVCGHSECGAMRALLTGGSETPGLGSWLRHGEPALQNLRQGRVPDRSLAPHNQLSQLNVLSQIEHLKSYPLIRERVQKGTLRLHGWWFELKNADVYGYDERVGRFVLIDGAEAERLLRQFDETALTS